MMMWALSYVLITLFLLAYLAFLTFLLHHLLGAIFYLIDLILDPIFYPRKNYNEADKENT